MAVNLATKYSDKVAERFKMKSLATGFTNRDYNWEGVKTLTVYQLPVVGLNNYDRTASSNRYGTPNELQDGIQTMTVSQDKGFTFIIDKGNKIDSMNVRDAGKALRREIDEVIVPTEDRYVFHKMASSAFTSGNKNTVTTGALDATKAYKAFLEGQTFLDNKLVPMGGRIAAVNASTLALLKQDSAFVLASELGQKIKINGVVGELDGVKIVKVPDNYLPTNCAFIITHPSVTVKAEKLHDYKIHDNPPGISGNLVEGRVYYDAFVLDAKKGGVFGYFSDNQSPALPDTPIPSL